MNPRDKPSEGVYLLQCSLVAYPSQMFPSLRATSESYRADSWEARVFVISTAVKKVFWLLLARDISRVLYIHNIDLIRSFVTSCVLSNLNASLSLLIINSRKV